MFKSVFTVALSAICAVSASNASTATGAIVSTQMYYLGQEMYTFNVVRTDMSSGHSTIIEELLSKSNQAGQLESFTAYEESTRSFYVAAASYPQITTATFWKSTINADATGTTPVVSAVEIKYPVSRSPAPLNVAHLQLSRLIVGPSGRLFATFLNGEVHEVDLEGGSFTYLYSLISDDMQLSEIHPYMTWGHLYDPSAEVMWSIAMGASDAFLMSSSFETRSVSSWVTMAMPEGDNSGFSPETVVNMHMVTIDNDAPRVMVIMESMHNLGFDQVSFLDTTTGQLDCKQCNMMSDLIELACDTNINACDKWRVSAWDADNGLLYFQAHSTSMETYGEIHLTTMGFDHNAATGNLNWYTNVGQELWYGLSGFQFVKLV